MRVGTALLIMLFILVGFGYLLSNNIQVTGELADSRNQVIQLKKEIGILQAQYNSVYTENAQLKYRVSRLEEENILFMEQVQDLKAENASLKARFDHLWNTKGHPKSSLSFLTNIMMLISDSLTFVLFIPILPLSIGMIILTRYLKLSSRRTKALGDNNQLSTYVRLTKEELKQVINARRGQL